MADEGHKLTDKLLKDLEKDVAQEYRTATREMQAKLTAYLEKTEAQRKVQEGMLKAGSITEKEYKDWCYRHTMVGKRWQQMCETLAEDMHHANQIALGMTKDKMPDIYALNANYATYQIETGGKIDTGFTLYNHDTAAYLLGDQRQLMPKPSTRKAAEIAANKDMQWNMRKIQSAVLQGVLQGESPYKVAERLRQVGQMNYNSAVRYARTMTTSAQNAGRYEAYRRADRLGVDLVIEWQATLDDRTRHDHRLMHGQRTDVDKPFHTPDGFTIYYPADCTGDSDAPQKEIWNCRCTLLSWVKGFEGDTVKESDKMDGMSFEEWQEAKPESREIFTSADKSVKMRSGSKQQREKAERMAELPTAGAAPAEDHAVVSQLKPIVGEHSRLDDAKATNPRYDKNSYEYGQNCSHCVTAYEARRRGYDVTALPLADDDKYARGNGYTLPYAKGNRTPTRLWVEKGYTLSNFDQFTTKQCVEAVEEMMNGYGNGARAIISGFWKEDNLGHVFVAENVGGKVQFYDPQNAKMDCRSYFDKLSPKSLDLFRVDDLPFSSEIKGVLKNDVI